MAKRGGLKITFEVRIYHEYLSPNGFLVNDPACHALFHYYNCALQTYKEQIETMKYETDRSQYNYFQLYKSVAQMYGVDPHKMQNFWSAVDLQATNMGLTLLPREQRYRAPNRENSVITTHGTR